MDEVVYLCLDLIRPFVYEGAFDRTGFVLLNWTPLLLSVEEIQILSIAFLWYNFVISDMCYVSLFYAMVSCSETSLILNI